jgi:hypothetical protein
MGDEISAPQGAPINNYVEFMTVNWINKMAEAEAISDWHKYYSWCSNALQLVKSHIPIKDRAAIERDWIATKNALIAAEAITNNTNRADTIEKIKKAFVEAHKFYIFDALPGMGIIRNEEDAVVDFDKISLEKVITITQSREGVETSIKNTLGGEDGK